MILKSIEQRSLEAGSYSGCELTIVFVNMVGIDAHEQLVDIDICGRREKGRG